MDDIYEWFRIIKVNEGERFDAYIHPTLPLKVE